MLIYWSMLYHLPTEYIEYWILQIQYNNYLQIYNRGSYKTWHLERFFTFECKGESLKQNSGGTQKDFYYTSKYNKMFLFFWSLPLLRLSCWLHPPWSGLGSRPTSDRWPAWPGGDDELQDRGERWGMISRRKLSVMKTISSPSISYSMSLRLVSETIITPWD